MVVVGAVVEVGGEVVPAVAAVGSGAVAGCWAGDAGRVELVEPEVDDVVVELAGAVEVVGAAVLGGGRLEAVAASRAGAGVVGGLVGAGVAVEGVAASAVAGAGAGPPPAPAVSGGPPVWTMTGAGTEPPGMSLTAGTLPAPPGVPCRSSCPAAAS